MKSKVNATDDWDPLWGIHRDWGTHPKLEQKPGYLIRAYVASAVKELRHNQDTKHLTFRMDGCWMLYSLLCGAGGSPREWKRWDLL